MRMFLSQKSSRGSLNLELALLIMLLALTVIYPLIYLGNGISNTYNKGANRVNGGEEAPPVPGNDPNAAWYVGGFYSQDEDYTNTSYYLAAFKSDGTSVWSIPAKLPNGNDGNIGQAGIAVSDTSLYVSLMDPSDWSSALYVYSDWKNPAGPEAPVKLLDFGADMTDTEGGTVRLNYTSKFYVSKDDKTLVFYTNDYKLALVDVASKIVKVVSFPDYTNGSPTIGLDGYLYVMTDPGNLYQVTGDGTSKLMWSNSDYSYNDSYYNITGVDAEGNSYFAETSLLKLDKVSADGTTANSIASIADGNLNQFAFTPDSEPIYFDFDSDASPSLNVLKNGATGATIKDSLFIEPVLERPKATLMSFASVLANISGSGGTPIDVPTALPPVDNGDGTVTIPWNGGTPPYSVIQVPAPGDNTGTTIGSDIPDNSYTITKPVTPGNYYYQVRDSKGNYFATAITIVVAPGLDLTGLTARIPADPADPLTQQVSPAIKWDNLPVGSGVQNYRIYMKYTDAPATEWALWDTIPVGQAQTEHTLIALSKTRYMDFKVVAWNGTIEGPASATLHVYRGNALPSLWQVTAENGWNIIDERD